MQHKLFFLLLFLFLLPVSLAVSSPFFIRQDVEAIPVLPSPDPIPSQCPVMLSQQPPTSNTRIVGGAFSSNQTASYMVALFRLGGEYMCSGVLISKRWFLTAAHCDIDTSWTVRIAGLEASTGAFRNISAVFNAEPPGITVAVQDIALVQLSDDAPPNASFVSVNADPKEPPVQSFARAVGYGKSDEFDLATDEKLRQVDIPITTLAYCKSVYEFLSDDKVCGGYAQGGCDACQGDSGGPLIQFDKKGNPVVVATISSGIGCSRPEVPGVYMRTDEVIDWMYSVGAEFTIAPKLDHVFDDTPPLSPRPTPSPRPSPPPLPTPSNSPLPTVCPVVLSPHPPKPMPDTRIIGGSLATRVTANYIVSLDDNFEYRCSGVLISKRWLLTVAHCDAETSWIVRFGGLDASSGEEGAIDKIFIPKQTNSSFPTRFPDDIALIRLTADAPSTSTFARVNTDDTLPLTESFARVVGYGRTNPNGVGRGGEDLRQVDVPIVKMDDCFAAYDWLTDDRVCAGYPDGGCDGCFGDGGGPLLQFDEDEQPVIMGLTSGGEGCALAGFPGVYMRVASFVSWMKNVGAEFKTTGDAVQSFQEVTTEPSEPPEDTLSPSPEGIFIAGCPVLLPQLPPKKGTNRITGGVDASFRAAKYMVALWDEKDLYRCSGIRLSRRWVLTVGVTCGATTNWTATLAQSTIASGSKVSIVEVFNASNGTDFKEISLLQLARSAPPQARFARVNADESVPVAGSFARVMGYGSTDVANFEPNGLALRQADIPVVSTKSCRDAWDADFLFDSLVCAGYQTAKDCGVCWGDEGGPLIQFDDEDRLVVVGAAFTNVECGKEGIPSIYVRTSAVVEWMRDVGADFVVADSVVPIFKPSASVKPSPSDVSSSGESVSNATGTSADLLSGDSGVSPSIPIIIAVFAGLLILTIGIVIPLSLRARGSTEVST